MKTILITIISLFVINQANAQLIGQCLKIVDLDLNLLFAGRTQVINIDKKNKKMIIHTKKDNKTYSFSIDMNKSKVFGAFINYGSRVTFSTEGKMRYVTIATPSLDGQKIDVKKFGFCK